MFWNHAHQVSITSFQPHHHRYQRWYQYPHCKGLETIKSKRVQPTNQNAYYLRQASFVLILAIYFLPRHRHLHRQKLLFDPHLSCHLRQERVYVGLLQLSLARSFSISRGLSLKYLALIKEFFLWMRVDPCFLRLLAHFEAWLLYFWSRLR